MKSVRWLAFLLLFGAAGAGSLHGQTRADSAAVLLNAAEQLRLRGETAAARVLLDFIERQYAGTAAAGEVARMRTSMRGFREAERSGRTELILWGTTYGAWLGVAVPLSADSDSPEAYGVGFLAGAPIGFLAARAYVNARQPTVGQARAITFGGSWGTYQGFAWAEALDIGERSIPGQCWDEFGNPIGVCYEYSETDETARVAASVLGGLAGIGTGAWLARKPISLGTAAAVGSGALWASWFGVASGVITGAEDDALLTTMLVAGNAGLVMTALAAPGWDVTEGRVRLVNVGGIIGGLAGVGLLLIAQPDDEKVAIAIPAISSAIGLAVGIATTRDMTAVPGEEPDGQGALINVNGGRWALNMPEATLRMQRTASGTKPAAYVPLLRARF